MSPDTARRSEATRLMLHYLLGSRAQRNITTTKKVGEETARSTRAIEVDVFLIFFLLLSALTRLDITLPTTTTRL